MNGIDIEQLIKSTIGAFKTEDLVVEALKDLFKDEIKKYIRDRIDENPKLKEEARAIIGELIQAKVKETYALMKLGKVAAELGVAIVPKELKEQMGRDLASLIEREISQVMEKL